MILIWGVPDDGPTRRVCAELERRGEAFFMLDQFGGSESEIDFDPADPLKGSIMVGDREAALGSIDAVYLRPYETGRVLRAAGVSDPATCDRARLFDDAMLLWTELTSAFVVNRPSAMTSNNSKPFQASLIAQAGFDVPATLLTSDAEEAARFVGRYGRAIYKSIGGVRSRVSAVTEAMIERLAAAACPLQIQECVDGVDYRVHVLGEMVFACSIESAASDYRYPGAEEESPVIRSVELPGEITGRCVELARRLGLAFTGIDLRRSPEGRWVCFEANPSPGYTFYEQATGALITEGLVAMLGAGVGGECHSYGMSVRTTIDIPDDLNPDFCYGAN